jgi:hypothetical protein
MISKKRQREFAARFEKSTDHGRKYPGVKNRHSLEVTDAQEDQGAARRALDSQIANSPDANNRKGN